MPWFGAWIGLVAPVVPPSLEGWCHPLGASFLCDGGGVGRICCLVHMTRSVAIPSVPVLIEAAASRCVPEEVPVSGHALWTRTCLVDACYRLARGQTTAA